ncbi:hypothetical protein K3495_g10419 [Podosphaera aphanis]|nr:hypothetical protein K3495_g10419 [Podosphaera aphanis]
MNTGQAAEPEFDYFSLILPLPYRVALAVVLGVWAWGANLQYLFLIKIDVPLLIHHTQRLSPRTDPPHYLSTYRLALFLTAPLFVSIVLFWALSHQKPFLVAYYSFLPVTYICFLVGVFILPLRRFSPTGRFRFITTIRRILTGRLAHSKDVRFGDVLLADVLTSYAKIIADLLVSLCMFFTKPLGTATTRPDRSCGGWYLVPVIIAIPSLIRLCQCLTEYHRVYSAYGKGGYGGQHLANALKYASAFPVIIFSTLQRHSDSSHQSAFLTPRGAYNCWLLATLVNSIYSFYWDVAKDWDLTFFSDVAQLSPPLCRGASTSTQMLLAHPSTKVSFGLRARLFLPSPSLYYLVIILDFFLRGVWSLRLFPHLGPFLDSEIGITLLEFAEISRRWIWMFLRLETEWVRMSTGKENSEPRVEDRLVKDHNEGHELLRN